MFYVVSKGWVAAGDKLCLESGKTVTVTGSELEKLEKPIKVYNLEVLDNRTYFVGDKAVLVHNEYDKTRKWSSKEVNDAAKDLKNGSTSVTISNRSQAEELFLGLYQGDGYHNTDGWIGEEIEAYFGGKQGTYHWDVEFEYKEKIKDYILKHHDINNPDAKIAHLQIHEKITGNIIRIFIEGIKP